MNPAAHIVVCESWKIATDLLESLGAGSSYSELVDSESLNPYQIPMVWTEASVKDILALTSELTVTIHRAV